MDMQRASRGFLRLVFAGMTALAIGCRPPESGRRQLPRSASDPSQAMSPAQQAGRGLRRGSRRLYQEGKLDEAVAKATEAIALHSDFAAAYEMRGAAYLDKKDLSRALADFTEASQREPRNGRLDYRKGLVHMELREFGLAETVFSQAMSKGYANPLVLLACGKACVETGKFPKALKAFERALEKDPDFAEVYVVRGKLYLRIQQRDPAAADFAMARKLGLDIGDDGEPRNAKKP